MSHSVSRPRWPELFWKHASQKIALNQGLSVNKNAATQATVWNLENLGILHQRFQPQQQRPGERSLCHFFQHNPMKTVTTSHISHMGFKPVDSLAQGTQSVDEAIFKFCVVYCTEFTVHKVFSTVRYGIWSIDAPACGTAHHWNAVLASEVKGLLKELAKEAFNLVVIMSCVIAGVCRCRLCSTHTCGADSNTDTTLHPLRWNVNLFFSLQALVLLMDL